MATPQPDNPTCPTELALDAWKELELDAKATPIHNWEKRKTPDKEGWCWCTGKKHVLHGIHCTKDFCS